MKSFICHKRETMGGCLLLLGAVFGCLSTPASGSTGSVSLSPGDNIQKAVQAAPAGTTFILSNGRYWRQSIIPKAGDTFIGQGTVILDGAQVLTFAPASGGQFWVADATAQNAMKGTCGTATPLCFYNQDLFLDSKLESPVASLSALQAGSWYFDRAAGKVYIASDPTGHVVELGIAQWAFTGKAANVVIKNLTVEKYATPAQTGAIGGATSGADWIVDTVESRLNHGAGMSLQSGAKVLNSYIHDNGQIGVKLFGSGDQLINNEISSNNRAGFAANWEAGGTKFWSTTNLTVQGNYVHDNVGNGLWADTDNVGTLYDGNTVVNNSGVGILHEVSYSATIRNNVIRGNIPNTVEWLGNAQITIYNSSNGDIYGNTIEVPAGYASGIGLVNDSRGSGTLGPWTAANNYVHDNTITYLGNLGQSGFTDDTGAKTDLGNVFNHNRYYAKNCTQVHWAWFKLKDWKAFQDEGQEQTGSCN